MQPLTVQIRTAGGWRDAATLAFVTSTIVEIEYDLDYAVSCLGERDSRALSVSKPVDTMPYRGPLPGFLLDLVPQGEPLRRILARYRIQDPTDYRTILASVPIAAPGNLRIKEPWTALDNLRASYRHGGFPLSDIIQHNTEFVDYMERHGAPIGGTSGAGGGSPKFLLRQDAQGHFHAEGMLDDARTRRCLLIKFPYTDSANSALLSRTEKLYYDFLRALPVCTGREIEIHDDILFIERFDRVPDGNGRLHYFGLESLYGAHDINTPGAQLWHEDNVQLLAKQSTEPLEDIIEYLKRDILNKVLANTDNHGRNTSLLKSEEVIRLSPLYDVTAMKFFAGDFIVELTRWKQEHSRLQDQLVWIAGKLSITTAPLVAALRGLHEALGDTEATLKKIGVPLDFINRARPDRDRILTELSKAVA
jgi:serine/threonine-protein kinase HipA